MSEPAACPLPPSTTEEQRCVEQLTPHWSPEILTATSLPCPQFVCAALLIKPWRPDHFHWGVLHDPVSGHMSMCTFVRFLLINILNFFNVWLTRRKVSSPGLCSLKGKFKAKECTCKLKNWTTEHFMWQGVTWKSGFWFKSYKPGPILKWTFPYFWLVTLRKMINSFLPPAHLAQ